MDIAAKLIELNLNADAAEKVWALLHDIQQEQAWAENARIDEIAELNQVRNHRDQLQREATRYAEALGEARYELAVAVGQRDELQAKFAPVEA